jgi:hypothetical protein
MEILQFVVIIGVALISSCGRVWGRIRGRASRFDYTWGSVVRIWMEQRRFKHIVEVDGRCVSVVVLMISTVEQS